MMVQARYWEGRFWMRQVEDARILAQFSTSVLTCEAPCDRVALSEALKQHPGDWFTIPLIGLRYPMPPDYRRNLTKQI
jgi:hypothetical protein